ncbi:hypothetical protein GJAV_G00192600 [Gymnothorax javanicus]|nr:hypothetical protein GJAV_G00192600 [Gymnothorax javanicus]
MKITAPSARAILVFTHCREGNIQNPYNSALSTAMGWILVLLMGLVLPGLQAFKPLFADSETITHRGITVTAILRKTTEVCRALALAEGRDFPISVGGRLTPFAVQRACSPSDGSLKSGVFFQGSIIFTYLSNAAVDQLYALSAPRHFDGEEFLSGRAIITEGMASIKANVREGNFISARLTLGTILHTLQDFYSHSNWIELEKRQPNANLSQAKTSIGDIADKSTPTCRKCIGDDCRDNILPEILDRGILTSGYFGIFKPAGKCSHGGLADISRLTEPTGGINKDTVDAAHGHLHRAAANMAIRASMELLEDIRGATGENDFLQLMGITRSSVLCFAIDTTGSMRDDIEEAKRVAFSIIDSRKGTSNEPSAYILVPFNDPGVGPLTRTTDSEIFKQRINALTASGGGDAPDLSLTGIQLALTNVPPFSEIFVFTDAPAKDTHLTSTVIALIESTKSVVNFLLTNVFGAQRRRNSDITNHMSASRNQLYQEIADASGGQAIEVSKDKLPQATAIIVDSSTSALVTVLQAVRSPGKPDNFTFIADASMRNVTIYLTGNFLTYSLTSPSGVSQDSSATDGPLGQITVVGNLHTIRVDTQTGLWVINVTSTTAYTLKVTGKSSIDFVYNIVEDLKGTGTDFTLREGRLQKGGNATILLSVVGGDDLTVTEVSLVEVSGSRVEKGTLKSLEDGEYLVFMEKVPDESFVILVKGANGTSRSTLNIFQRQSTTQLKTSSLTVTVSPNGAMEPGVPFSVNFTVMSDGTPGTYTIRAQDDKGFITSAPSSLILGSEGSAQGTVELQAPDGTPSGTEVTLTIVAESPGGGDTNSAVRRISVLKEVTDFSRPVCQVVSVSNDCPQNCSQSEWELSANMTDGNGTGIRSITVRVGNGTLNTTTFLGEAGFNVTVANYNASCCSPDVELVVVDRTQLTSARAMMGWLHILLMGLLLPGLQAFFPLGFLTVDSITHDEITETAILRKTTEVCRALALAAGRDFPIPEGGKLSATAVQRACFPSEGFLDSLGSVVSGINFKRVIISMYLNNAQVDLDFASSAPHHFDREEFLNGKGIITGGTDSIKASVKEGNFVSARMTLGAILHNLQDFYSHSNWIEMEKRQPNTNLIQKDASIGDFAGKCSHGGFFDDTKSIDPIGGINKDTFGAEHGHLHQDAADVAVRATMELLEDIRGAAGEKDFLQLMGITRSSVLCFVIDTTGSMRDDIEEAKRLAFSIIDRKNGTSDEPSAYILIPFNDPDVGPLTRTTDSDIFKQRINALTASGGDDAPELSLTGIQLALTNAPPFSEIFVFTDAPAKDSYLRSTVNALTQRTQSAVTFLLTNVLGARRRRNSGIMNRMSASGNKLYQEIAEESGGLAIEVSKDKLPQATAIIADSSTSALVTVLQVVRKPGRPDDFTFTVDASMRNLTIYLTGNSLTYSLTSPSGMSQDSSATDGPLGQITVVGNLHTIRVDIQAGLWEINVTSTTAYTLKVTGKSSIDFVYNFVEDQMGIRTNFTLREGRLQTGGSATLLLSVVGGDDLTVTEVSLVEVSGSRVEKGTLKSLEDGDYLVFMEKVPDESFVILVKGANGMSRSTLSNFQRQSTTQLKTSNLTVTVSSNGAMEPGVPFSVNFTVMSDGTPGNYTIRAQDDKGFITSAPSSLILGSEGSAQGTVELQAPDGTPSGTEVTLTIVAESPGGGDTNSAVHRISVLKEVTDFSRPVCQVVSVSNDCPQNCSQSEWELSANMTDGNGTGIRSITVRIGNGTLDTTTFLGEAGFNITVANYNASCCSPDVELVVVDRVGNVGTCFHSIRATPAVTPNATTSTTTSPVTNQTVTSAPSIPTTTCGATSHRLLLLLIPTSLLAALLA